MVLIVYPIFFKVDSDGRSWRSGALVERKKLKQWFFKVTAFADVRRELARTIYMYSLIWHSRTC